VGWTSQLVSGFWYDIYGTLSLAAPISGENERNLNASGSV
jgi:hypothetical protein